MALITNYMNQGKFKWTSVVAWAFKRVKRKMAEAPVLHLPS